MATVNELAKAKAALEKAKEVRAAAQKALDDFSAPFENNRTQAQSDSYRWQSQLSTLREQWKAAIDKAGPVAEIEAEIGNAETELKRAKERIDAATSWAQRERPALKKLKDALETAYYEWLKCYQELMELERAEVHKMRESYLQSLENYWGLAREAAHFFKIPKFLSTELEVDWKLIRQRTGDMWQ